MPQSENILSVRSFYKWIFFLKKNAFVKIHFMMCRVQNSNKKISHKCVPTLGGGGSPEIGRMSQLLPFPKELCIHKQTINLPQIGNPQWTDFFII